MRDTESHIDDGEQSANHSRQFDTRASRRAFLKTTAGTIAVGVAGESVAAAEGPTLGVDLSSDQIDVGGTATGTVTLSSAPSGLSGFELEVTVDSSVASIDDATYDDAFGLSDGPQIASDGSSVTLQAVDVQDNVSGSPRDVALGTITLTGASDGETAVSVASGSADADGGAAIGPATSATTLTVGSGGAGGGNTDTGSDGTDGGSSQYPTWDPDTVYRSGDRVVYEATVWEAQWYSTGDEPRDEDYYVWAKIGPATGSGGSDDGADRGQGDDETEQGDTGGGNDAPTVSATLSTDGIQAGRTAEASIQLSNAPDGLAGYAVDVTVDDPSVATVTDASYANAFGLTSEAQIAADGSSVRLEAADVQDSVTPGDTDVELATVTLSGEGAGTTSVDVTVQTLDADDGSTISARATNGSLSVGGDTGETEPTEDEEADDGEDSSSADALVVNDYDGSPGWPGQNDLGNWCGAGSFGNAGVSDGALVLEYDNSGWLIETVNRDVSDYSKLVLRLKGSAGGEGSHFTVSAGGSSNVFADVAGGSVSTSYTDVAVDLDAAGISGSLGQLRLEFWQGGSGTLSIEEIRLE